jgi:hypothetical protein
MSQITTAGRRIRGNRYKHGHAAVAGRQTREYVAWCKMKGRCYDPKNNRYSYYGARGIEVCPQWRDDFAQFLADVGPCPDGHSLGRKNNNEGYGPQNCRWETPAEQSNNRRNNVLLTVRGKTQNLTQWAAEVGTPSGRIRLRLIRGWSHEEAIFTPTKRPDLTFAKH